MTYEEIPTPDDLVDIVAEWREKLLEAVAEYDDTLMEKYFLCWFRLFFYHLLNS